MPCSRSKIAAFVLWDERYGIAKCTYFVSRLTNGLKSDILGSHLKVMFFPMRSLFSDASASHCDAEREARAGKCEAVASNVLAGKRATKLSVADRGIFARILDKFYTQKHKVNQSLKLVIQILHENQSRPVCTYFMDIIILSL